MILKIITTPTWYQIFYSIAMWSINSEYNVEIYIAIYMLYVPKKYEENWGTLLVFRSTHSHTRAARSIRTSFFVPRRERAHAWLIVLPHSFGVLCRHFSNGETYFWNLWIHIKFSNKGLRPSVFLKSLTLGTFLKNSCYNRDFETHSQTF